MCMNLFRSEGHLCARSGIQGRQQVRRSMLRYSQDVGKNANQMSQGRRDPQVLCFQRGSLKSPLVPAPQRSIYKRLYVLGGYTAAAIKPRPQGISASNLPGPGGYGLRE